jgi:hypothetical protein
LPTKVEPTIWAVERESRISVVGLTGKQPA